MRFMLAGLCLCLFVGDVLAGVSEPQANPGVESPSLRDSVQTLPFKRDEPVNGGLLGRIAVSGIVLLLLAFAVLYVLKKSVLQIGAGPSPGRHIQVLETRRLTPKTILFLVQTGPRRILLAQTAEGITVLDKSDAPEGETRTPDGAENRKITA